MSLIKDKKKKKHKKHLEKLKKINKKKYQTRKDKRRKEIPDQILALFCENNEQIDLFVQEILSLEDEMFTEQATSLLMTTSSEVYEEKVRELKNKPVKSPDKFIERYREVKKLERKSERRMLDNTKDLSLISIMNPKMYTKKFISIPEYRKELKRLAQREKEEMDIAVANGFLSFDINEYEKRIAQNAKDEDFIYKSHIY